MVVSSLSMSGAHHSVSNSKETSVLVMPFSEWQGQEIYEPYSYFHFLDEETEMALTQQAISPKVVKRRL